MPASDKTRIEGLTLLKAGRIDDFNRWRMTNLTFLPDFSGEDFSGARLQNAYLNGLVAIDANFSACSLDRANLVQAHLDGANFTGASLSRTLLMYAELKNCNFTNADLSGTNLMWANAQGANFTGAKFAKTIFVEASLQTAKLEHGKADSFLKYAKTDGTNWSDKSN